MEEDKTKYRGQTLKYWKDNAEEDYLKVPISVLKYISVLEELKRKATIKVVDDTPHINNYVRALDNYIDAKFKINKTMSESGYGLGSAFKNLSDSKRTLTQTLSIMLSNID